mgnify:CR=1 FL=1
MNSKTVITIGRQFGSGGKEIGEKLAKELGIRCYDKELLAVAAKESGLCKELFENHDEKPTNSFLYSLVMDTYSLGYTSSYSDMPINHKVFLAQFDAIKKIAEEIGKTPVQVNEAAGFVVNRILIPMINEAAFIKMEGVSDIAGIDAAMKLGANHPMGPLELGDFIGLDICLAIMDVLYNETGDSKYRACPLLRKMVRGGNLGCKSGKGFYVYNADRTKTPVDAQ